MSIEEFLNLPEIVELLKQNNISEVYDRFIGVQGCGPVGLTNFLLSVGIDPLLYMKHMVSTAFAHQLAAYDQQYAYRNVIIPHGIEFIGQSAFERANVEHIQFSNSLFQIRYNAFRNNKLSGKLNLQNCLNLESILNGAFIENDLEELILPSSIRVIQDRIVDSNVIVKVPKGTRLGITDSFGYSTQPDFAIEYC